MRKFIVITVLLILSVKYGLSYVLSNDFEVWADQKKVPWTCQFENFAGEIHLTMSNYGPALMRFSHTLARCPEGPLAEEAAFETARALEGLGRRHDAYVAYQDFIRKYPSSDRFRAASRATEILNAS